MTRCHQSLLTKLNVCRQGVVDGQRTFIRSACSRVGDVDRIDCCRPGNQLRIDGIVQISFSLYGLHHREIGLWADMSLQRQLRNFGGAECPLPQVHFIDITREGTACAGV